MDLLGIEASTRYRGNMPQTLAWWSHIRHAKQGTDRSRDAAMPSAGAAVLRELARGRHPSPQGNGRPFVRHHRFSWAVLVLCLGLVIDACLVLLLVELMQMVLALLGLWELLARHAVGI